MSSNPKVRQPAGKWIGIVLAGLLVSTVMPPGAAEPMTGECVSGKFAVYAACTTDEPGPFTFGMFVPPEGAHFEVSVTPNHLNSYTVKIVGCDYDAYVAVPSRCNPDQYGIPQPPYKASQLSETNLGYSKSYTGVDAKASSRGTYWTIQLWDNGGGLGPGFALKAAVINF